MGDPAVRDLGGAHHGRCPLPLPDEPAMTSVTEKEARFILQTHAAIGNEHQHSLPENRDKFDFLLKPLQDLLCCLI